MDLRAYLVAHVSPSEYYSKQLGIDFQGAAENVVVYCPFHEDKNTKSLSIDLKTGKGFCHSPDCGEQIADIVGFHCSYYGKAFKKSLHEIYSQFVEKIVDTSTYMPPHRHLLDNKEILDYLLSRRRWTLKTIRKRKIGYLPQQKRVTIPIFNKFGFCVNVRYYDVFHRDKNQKFYGIKGCNRPRLYPEQALLGEKIFLMAGEPDFLCADSFGLPAITVSGSEGAWTDKFISDFTGKHLVIVPDKDKAGFRATKQRISHLKSVVASLKVINLPLPIGKDFTDYIVEGGFSRKEFLILVRDTDYLIKPRNGDTFTPVNNDIHDDSHIALSEASHAVHYKKPIIFEAMVTGKHQQPYLAPKKIRIICDCQKRDKICEFCLTHESTNNIIEVPLQTREIVKLIECGDDGKYQALREIFDLPRNTNPNIETLETFNVVKAKIIPKVVLRSSKNDEFVKRIIYYIGHDLACNKNYRMRGFTVPDKNQAATHIITEAVPIDALHGKHILPPSSLKAFKVFHEKPLKNMLQEKYADMSRHVTNIYERNDLHLAVDLVFHSVLGFNFNNEYVHRGWLDALILGDTRLGKSVVAQALSQHYDLGTIISGENSTPVGIVGGISMIGNQAVETWGAAVNNTKGLLIIDELSDLQPDQIARLSRIRSEGIAEIDKADIHAKTTCQTRLLCLSNCRNKSSLTDYNFGVEAVRDLYGHLEDISRCDYVLSVTRNEVDATKINRLKSLTGAERSPLTDKELCRDLILWIWSLASDEVVFETDAVELCLAESNRLGELYTSDIPLIQPEDVRHKIARIAAAFAGLQFSSPDGKTLVVKKLHVAAALGWLKSIYTKPSMGYLQYARAYQKMNTLDAGSELWKFMVAFNDGKQVIENLMQLDRMTLEDMGMAFGQADRVVQGAIATELIKARAVVRKSGYFNKTSAFVKFLNNKLHNLELLDGGNDDS